MYSYINVLLASASTCYIAAITIVTGLQKRNVIIYYCVYLFGIRFENEKSKQVKRSLTHNVVFFVFVLIIICT